MNDLITKAKQLATERHAHLHLHNLAQTPAITHIAEVARFVEENNGTEAMIAAAWLHDIVEDTDVRLEDIGILFGAEIMLLVDGLTDPSHFAVLPLAERKPMQADRLKIKSDEVKRIKICDQVSNSLRTLRDPPAHWDSAKSFAYIHGAKMVADVCHGLCPPLDKLMAEAYEQAQRQYR